MWKQNLLYRSSGEHGTNSFFGVSPKNYTVDLNATKKWNDLRPIYTVQEVGKLNPFTPLPPLL